MQNPATTENDGLDVRESDPVSISYETDAFYGIVGHSEAMQDIFRIVERGADSDSTIS